MNNTNQNLKIIHWNANGITNKLNELHSLVNHQNIDIILLNETHLKPSLNLKIPNYHTYRTDLPPIRGSPAHGGTAILVHRRIIHKPTALRTELQSTSIIIKLNNIEILISSVYKPPNLTLDPIDLDTLTQTSDWSISAGDLNSKHPLWNSRTTNSSGSTLFNHIQRSDYSVLAPTTPTYYPYAHKFRPDVLDIALVKVPLPILVTNLNALSSDHNPILLEIYGTPITPLPPSPSRIINWNKYVDTLTLSPINVNPPVNNIPQIDSAIDLFTNTINTAILNSSHIPLKRKNPNTLPDEIINEIRQKNRLRRVWQSTRDPTTKRLLNNKINFIRAIIATHKQDEWDKFLDSLDHKDGSIYKISKSLLHKSPATHPLLGPNGLVFSPHDKAELLADSMAHQFTLNPGPDLPEVSLASHKLSSEPVTTKYFTSPGTIFKIISKLPKKRAPGEDLITNSALRFLPKNMILTLCKILNGCLRICYFPNSWKRASIIGIPKPGKDPTLPASYRPIALLSSISKILEKIILRDLQTQIRDKIIPEQAAFRREHSTTQQLVKLVDLLTSNINSHICTATVFLDIEKAFDRVWHEGLLYKMTKMNISPNITKIIQSFLQNRTFSAKIDGAKSSPRSILAGVPQGSCLAPTLYLIYTNDIPTLHQVQVSLFADDTMFLTSNTNPKMARFRLQKQIYLASSWFRKWRLTINSSKTVAVLFSHSRQNTLPKLSLNDSSLPWATHVKYLGVTLSRTLNFSLHISNTIKKAVRNRGMLYPLLNRNSPIPARTRINLFKMYVLPILTYAGASWAPLISNTQWKKIEAVQTTAVRIILGLPTYVRNQYTLSTAGLISIKENIHNQSSALFHRNAHSTFNHIKNLGLETPIYPPKTTNPKLRPIEWISSPL